MKDNSFYNKIHRLGRITVVCALISFMAVPFGLAAVNGTVSYTHLTLPTTPYV